MAQHTMFSEQSVQHNVPSNKQGALPFGKDITSSDHHTSQHPKSHQTFDHSKQVDYISFLVNFC